jgi:hypothetical protein
MREEDKIYADQGEPATLYVDGRDPIDCPTLQEAKLAWNRLSPQCRKQRPSGSSAGESMGLEKSIACIIGPSRLRDHRGPLSRDRRELEESSVRSRSKPK